MQITAATEPGSQEHANEDWYAVSPTVLMALDGLTARLDTGCRHGVAWYTHQLSSALLRFAGAEESTLKDALKRAIQHTAELHPECDLQSPSTPAAAVGMVRLIADRAEYLVLGDVRLSLDLRHGLKTVTDQRIEQSAQRERIEANRFPIGSEEKESLLMAMKRAEVLTRNHVDGYWVAAADPEAAEQSVAGSVLIDDMLNAAILTDGAARIVDPFGLLTWEDLHKQLRSAGPVPILAQLRSEEANDSLGTRWPRNKAHDDATIVYLSQLSQLSQCPNSGST